MSNRPPTSTADVRSQIATARSRERAMRKSGLRATRARYDAVGHRILLDLSNGYLFGFPVRAIPALARATRAHLEQVEVSPSGSTLRWDALDVDLSVSGLVLSTIPRAEQASELARIAGRVKSAAKSRSARANGAKGGRPRTKAKVSRKTHAA